MTETRLVCKHGSFNQQKHNTPRECPSFSKKKKKEKLLILTADTAVTFISFHGFQLNPTIQMTCSYYVTAYDTTNHELNGNQLYLDPANNMCYYNSNAQNSSSKIRGFAWWYQKP
jgi:hypothetical protein